MESSLISTFRQTCASYRDRPAIVDGQGVLNFADMGEQVERLAAWLHGQGLEPRQTVAVSIGHERSHLLASLALMRLGCPQVTLAPHDQPSQRQALIAKCRPVAVVGDGSDDDGLPVILPDFEAAAGSHEFGDGALPVPDDDTLSLLLPGSGTMGTFKVIAMSHRAMLWQALCRSVAAPSGVEYIPSPIGFLFPKRNRLRSVLTGYTALFRTAEHSELPDVCRHFGVSVLRLSPPQLQSLIDLADAGVRLPGNIAVCVAGARIPGSTRAAFQSRVSPALYVEYGATEIGNIAVAGPEAHPLHPEGVGRPVPGVELEIVDEIGRRLPPEIEGMILVRGPGMVNCYFEDEELTAKAFRDGWYHTGDRGALAADGTLIFGGRADDMMILNSINIFPSEIEKVAETFPGVVECVAFPMRSTIHGDIPVLAVVGADGYDLKGLMSYCREKLGVRAPRKVVFLSEIPRNPQGKVVRRDLSLRAAEGAFR
ncbi:MAG: class I adenylate-forming enzyme family protein [Sphingomonadales bacterium]